MGARKNNRQQKAAVAYDGHNRKAGVTAATKTTRHKHSRRTGKLMAQNIIRQYEPHVFGR